MTATSTTVTGAYTKFSFNITGLALSGTNSLAIEVNPNNPQTMFTLDDVDWNQIPPDNNTGIEFPVQLAVDGALSDGTTSPTTTVTTTTSTGRIPRRNPRSATSGSRRGMSTSRTTSRIS